VHGKAFGQLAWPMREVGALLDAKAVHGGRSAYNHLLCLAQTNNLPRRRVNEVLELVGLQDVARKRSKGFSLGMSQRLGIAAALLGDPATLMFDEPVNGLDPDGILWIRNLMKGLAAEGRTVFVSSHLMSEMENTADRLIVIGRGRLIADCTVAEFIAANSTQKVRVLTPQRDLLAKVAAAAISAVVGLLFVLLILALQLPSSWHVSTWVPLNAGSQIWQTVASPASAHMLSAWTGFALFCGREPDETGRSTRGGGARGGCRAARGRPGRLA
jgi:ABC transporter